VGEVVRLSGGTVTLQDAVDAFLDHHDLARSTRWVYRASLASLVAALGPATAVGELSGPRVAGWFRDRHATAAPATWNRELATLRAAVGWWRRRGWLAVDPTGDLQRRRGGSTAPGPSPAANWSGCSPAAISRCASAPCGGCCMRPSPAPTSCSPWTWKTWTWPTDGPGSTARAARSSGCSGRPDRPSSSPACWPAGPADRSSWVTAGQPAPSPAWTWTRPVGERDCRTGGQPSYFHVRTGWTLHQLRHSALTHAAEDGTNLPLLLARSRHASVRSLERYAGPGPEAVARHLAKTGPARLRP
jgi:integrase/recombinase XerD